MHNGKKNVLITGTTSGIGEALAKQFATRGYGLVFVSRSKEKLIKQKTAFERKYSVPIYIIEKDLCEENAPAEIYQELKEVGISIHILVNNAGFNECGAFSKTQLEKEIDMIKVHDIATTRLTKLFLPNMMKSKWGHILNLGSIGSYAPFPLNAVYAASKAYILNYSLALRSELKSKNINVTTLTPGATKTEFAEKAGINHTLLFSNFVLSSDKVASKAVKGMLKKKAVITPGIYNKLLVLSMKITPYAILQKISPIFYKDVG
ncbi:short-chain dehydrogenase [Clostridia bacterium]|nr:short-chain dehydrogenase [Clostridia bacterium]